MDDHAQTQQMFTALVGRAATRFAEGRSRTDVIAEFETDGVSREAAEALATRGEAVKKAVFRKAGTKEMLVGAGLAGLGIAITAGTYAAASGGGHYVVTYGIVIVGGWMLLKGLWRSVAG